MEKLQKGLEAAMRTLMSIVMLVLIVFGFWQIFSRWVLNDPSTFTDELLRYVLVWAGMIGAGYAFFKDTHVKLTLLTSRLKGTALMVVNVIDEIVILAFVGYVYIYGGIQLVIHNTDQLTAVLRLSMGLIYACLPVAGVFVILSKILRYISLYQEHKTVQGGDHA